jgi:colanic acid biosynthesis protein WcaH
METVNPLRPNRWLFKMIIKNAPLVSIDLIIRNTNGDYLLNRRGNHPAYNNWFFFGGSIKKPEKPRDAFIRIINREFFSGLPIDFIDAKFTKLAVHLYKENLSNYVKTYEQGIQYYVLCYEFTKDLADSELQEILDQYKVAAKKKLINKLRSFVGLKVEPQVKEIKWFSEAQLMTDLDVHDNVKNYFTDNPSTIIGSAFIPPSNETGQFSLNSAPNHLKNLLTLYQTQSKSINSYTTVIWAFPIIFLVALGNIYIHFNQCDLVMILSIWFSFILNQAFRKHTYIHEALKKSLDDIETSIKQESESVNKVMPNWESVNIHPKSHLAVRKFLNVFTASYILVSLLTIVFNHINIDNDFINKIREYIIIPLSTSIHRC